MHSIGIGIAAVSNAENCHGSNFMTEVREKNKLQRNYPDTYDVALQEQCDDEAVSQIEREEVAFMISSFKVCWARSCYISASSALAECG